MEENSKTVASTKIHINDVNRLLVVASVVKNVSVILSAVRSNVICVGYKYETSTNDAILEEIAQSVKEKKIESIALVLNSRSNTLHLNGRDDSIFSAESVPIGVCQFFRSLADNYLTSSRCSVGCRVDLLGCSTLQRDDCDSVAAVLSRLIKLPVTVSRDIMGTELKMPACEEVPKMMYIGELYFRPGKIRTWSGRMPSMAGFEKIRTVGKGAYGTAVLYRKKDDDSLVILKEINLHDLNVAERQMAQNEIRVLAMLDHPNVIGYYDSFEEDGLLMIEMEYADGGTLGKYLSSLDKPLEEKEILEKFMQIAQAIKCIHMHNILHRDLKTANIFLTREGVIKVGDFGISKLMSTVNGGANTVLGTPYYISPEMCEGKSYNEKSDVWALGCILYEMTCLQKTFDGSNLPALVNKIMKGQYAPVRGNYSEELKMLIMDMLQRNPDDRPSTEELCSIRLPELIRRFEELSSENDDEHGSSDLTSRRHQRKTRRTRSVLFMYNMSSQVLSPVELPSRIKIRELAMGSDHIIVVSLERMVYGWGNGSKGQLGNGCFELRSKPQLIESLSGKSVIRACCGDEFSVFASENGIVMTCGEGRFGCLGHGDWTSISRPRLIEALLSVDVVSVAAGEHHVVVVGGNGEVFTWGKAANGRLGHNSVQNCCQPVEVQFSESHMVKECRCGRDGTMLITEVRSVLACGNNEHNKLGLNQRQGFLMHMKNMFNKCEVAEVRTFTVVRALARHRVVDISMGAHHTCVIVEPGHVFTLGRNNEAQLGTGNTRPQTVPIEVTYFQKRPAFKVLCGDHYTVASTADNDLVLWGLLQKSSRDCNHFSDDSTHTGDNKNFIDINDAAVVLSARTNHARNSSVSSCGSNKDTDTEVNSKERDTCRILRHTRDDAEIYSLPHLLLKLDSTGSLGSAALNSSSLLTVSLASLHGCGDTLYLHVETTAPLPRAKSKKRRLSRNQLNGEMWRDLHPSASSQEGGDEYSSETSDFDKSKTLPEWLKKELQNAASSSTLRNSSGTPADSNTTNESSEHLPRIDPSSSNSVIPKLKLEKVSSKRSLRSELEKGASFSDGVEHVTEIDLQSSSSSNDIGFTHAMRKGNKMEMLPRKTNLPPINRVKSGARSKSMTRVRTQTKIKSRATDSNIRTGKADNSSSDTENLQLLQAQMNELMADRIKLQQQLKEVHEEQKIKQKLTEAAASNQSNEKVGQLQREIEDLKVQLRQQNVVLENNDRIINSLKTAMEKLQTKEKEKKSENKPVQSSRSAERLPSLVSKSSKICAIQ